MPSHRILLVDDDPEVVDRLQQLAGDRLEFVCTADATTVVRRLTDEPWDLVLMDVNLLIARGERLVELITRRVPERSRPPIVFFSAEDDARLATLAREAGIAGYISKGERNDHLLAAIESHLAVRR